MSFRGGRRPTWESPSFEGDCHGQFMNWPRNDVKCNETELTTQWSNNNRPGSSRIACGGIPTYPQGLWNVERISVD